MALHNYAALQDEVLNWLARPGDPLVAPSLPSMVRLFEAEATRRLKVGAAEKFAVITTGVGTSSVDLPSDFGQMRRCSVNGRSLTYVSPTSLPGLSGIPLAYTLWGQTKLWLGPAAAPVCDVEILYQSGVPPLTTADTTNWLLEQSPDAYLFGVLAEAELFIGHDERAPLWAQRRDAAFASIELADRKARWGSPLQIRVDGITIAQGGAGGPGGGSAMASAFVGDTPPPHPLEGNLWWDSVGGQLYTFFIDESGPPGAWIAATNQPVASPGTGPGSIATVSPASGDTVTMTIENPSIYVASPALAALTIRMPPSPAVGDTAELCFAAPVTTLQVQDSAGAPVAGAPTTAFGPGAAIIMRYVSGGWSYWK